MPDAQTFNFAIKNFINVYKHTKKHKILKQPINYLLDNAYDGIYITLIQNFTFCITCAKAKFLHKQSVKYEYLELNKSRCFCC